MTFPMDNGAAFSKIFKKWVVNCSATYKCTEHATVNEILIPFGTKQKIWMHIKKQACKTWPKVMCLLYVPILDVLKLVRLLRLKISIKILRVTTGSIQLYKLMSKHPGVLRMWVQWRKARKELSPEFQPNKQRRNNSTLLLVTEQYYLFYQREIENVMLYAPKWPGECSKLSTWR